MIIENTEAQVEKSQDATVLEQHRLQGLSNANLAGELKRAIRLKAEKNPLAVCVAVGCLAILGRHMGKSFLDAGNDPYRLKYSETRPKVGRQRKKS